MDLVPWNRKSQGNLWDAFDTLRGEMERSLGDFKLSDVSGLLDASTAPAIDVMETGDSYIVIADLPGIKKDDLELNVAGTLLTLKGSKRLEQHSEKRKFFRKETWAGNFNRTIELPPNIATESIEAELKDGVLAIRIAKKEEAKTKSIAIKVNG
jgi:HSP20 family protein